MKLKNPGKKLTEADVTAVEARWGIEFPAEYRTFLFKHNGGEPMFFF